MCNDRTGIDGEMMKIDQGIQRLKAGSFNAGKTGAVYS